MESANGMANEKADHGEALSVSSGEDDERTSSKKLVWKLDLHILPMVTILYLLSFLDRSNVANARLEGLTKDLHMTGIMNIPRSI